MSQRLNWGWRSIPNSMTSAAVRPFFGRLEYFVKFWKNNTFDLCQVVNVVFSCLWKYIIPFHTCRKHFPKNLSCDPKYSLNIFSNCKTLCKFNWKGFQDKFANYSPRQAFCLQLKRSAKFSLQRIEPAPISGNLCQRRSGGEGWSKGGN